MKEWVNLNSNIEIHKFPPFSVNKTIYPKFKF